MTEPNPAPSPAPAPTPAPAPAPAPAPNPAPAPDPKATIVNPAPAPNPDPAPQPDPKGVWPEDWRDRMANGDAKYRAQLERYASPSDLAKKTRELETKLSSGEYKRDLPKDATDEQKAAWREERGLPKDAGGYVTALALPDGVVLGEEDKPIVSEFAAAAHAGDMDPKHFSALVAKYYEMQDKQLADRADADAAYHQDSMAALGQEFGASTRREINGVNAFVGQFFPGELGANILVARTPDGRMLGDNPGFVKALASLNRLNNPASTVLPNGGADPASLAARKAELTKLQGDQHSAYWVGPTAGTLQAEYLAIVRQEEKDNSRK